MPEQEIIEGNKLIAEFMKFPSNKHLENWVDVPNEYISIYGKHFGIGFNCKFHKSWDWLMPVVEKIKDVITLGYFNIDSTWHDELRQEWVIQWSNSSPSRSFCIKRSDFKKDIRLIELLWFAVVEFIKWYNKCQK